MQGLQWANSRCEPLSLILVDDDDDDDDDDFSKDCSSYDDDVKQLLKSVFCILPLLMVRVLDNYFFDDRPKIVT